MSESLNSPQSIQESKSLAKPDPTPRKATGAETRQVREVDEAYIALLQKVGREATAHARAELRAKGIKPVISRDGQIVELDDDED